MNHSNRPIKVLQYGQGNFLRAFADDFIQTLNTETDFNGNIVIVKPTSRGNLDKFKQQACRYHVVFRGLAQGKTINTIKEITSVTDCISPYTEYESYMAYATCDTLRFILSNTTEAGITDSTTDTLDMTPPDSYPGKLTQFLYARYRHFHGDRNKGLVILPTELIDDNGSTLKAIVFKLAERWELEEAFLLWLEDSCIFANTLVDRIVSGFPKKNPEDFWAQIGEKDQLLVTAEPFGLWVIEADESLKEELCVDQTNLPIIFTDNYKPYKERKVRILNGAHTSSALLAYCCHKQYVKEMLEDPRIKTFLERVLFDEIIPCLSLPEDVSKPFAMDVLERFANPFIDHALLDISLNSISKWQARCLPSLRDYMAKYGQVPTCLRFSLAALLHFYQFGMVSGEYEVKDDLQVLAFFDEHKHDDAETLVNAFLQHSQFHGLHLEEQNVIKAMLINDLHMINQRGIYHALQEVLHG